jgi:hypothetical protein
VEECEGKLSADAARPQLGVTLCAPRSRLPLRPKLAPDSQASPNKLPELLPSHVTAHNARTLTPTNTPVCATVQLSRSLLRLRSPVKSSGLAVSAPRLKSLTRGKSSSFRPTKPKRACVCVCRHVVVMYEAD